jgi:hypothetical protein
MLTIAGLATLGLVCVGIFLPGLLVPSVVGVGALGLVPVVALRAIYGGAVGFCFRWV